MNSTKPARVQEVIALRLCRDVVFTDETCHDKALSTRRHRLTVCLGLAGLCHEEN